MDSTPPSLPRVSRARACCRHSKFASHHAIALALAAALMAAGCERQAPDTSPPAAVVPHDDSPARDSVAVDSLARADSLRAAPPVPALGFMRFAVVTGRRTQALHDSLGDARWLELLKLNRVDDAHVRKGDTLIVPLAWSDSLALSPFPRTLDAVRDTAKLLLVSIRLQAFAAYDSGRLVQWGPVSTGRKDKPTPVGLYHTNWKAKSRISTIDEAWLLNWYVNLDNFEGVSFHQYEMPGRPVSHSCVRLLESDARWVYAYADQWRVAADRRTILSYGTPTVIFGDWTYGQRQPWKFLPENPAASALTPDDVADVQRHLAVRTRPDFSIILPDDSTSARAKRSREEAPPPSGISSPAPEAAYDTLHAPADSTRVP